MLHTFEAKERYNPIREQLKENVEHKVWAGKQDLTLVQPVDNLLPGQTQTVLINLSRDHLPPVASLPRMVLEKYMEISGRSRLAQAGTAPPQGALHALAQSITETDWCDLQEGALLQKGLQLTNFGERALALDAGTGIAKFFTLVGGRQLSGQELYDFITSGEVDFGKEGEFWVPRYMEDRSRPTVHDMIAVDLLLDPTYNMHLKPGIAPLRLQNNGFNHGREQIEPESEPVRKTPEPKLWIGRTRGRINLKDNADAVIIPEVRSQQRSTRKGTGTSLESDFLHRFSNAHQIKVEIVGTTEEQEQPDAISVELWVDAKK
jgi:hypothetical protein